MKKYATELKAIRWGTVGGTRPWGTRYKLAEINRGTHDSIRTTAKNEQAAVTRWLFTHWPTDIWLITISRSDDETVGYELFAEFCGTRKRVQDAAKLRYKLRRERRATRRL
jgi:hypothetical protein